MGMHPNANITFGFPMSLSEQDEPEWWDDESDTERALERFIMGDDAAQREDESWSDHRDRVNAAKRADLLANVEFAPVGDLGYEVDSYAVGWAVAGCEYGPTDIGPALSAMTAPGPDAIDRLRDFIEFCGFQRPESPTMLLSTYRG